jgi:hypothetical protein
MSRISTIPVAQAKGAAADLFNRIKKAEIRAILALASRISILLFLSACSATLGESLQQSGTTNPVLRAHTGGQSGQAIERPDHGHS